MRDSAKIEGEKTFGESRIDSTHEGYNKILENDAVKEALSSENGVPLFEDLGMDHIKIMREKGVDLRQLFLVDTAGKSFNAEKFAAGDTFYISFSTNSDLADAMDFSFMDSSAETLSID